MLKRITITGADDAVDPKFMGQLALEYPFLDWALLANGKVTRGARFPTSNWIERLREQVSPARLAVHFCGQLSRRLMDGHDEDIVGNPWLYGVPTFQVNGFSSDLADRLHVVIGQSRRRRWVLQVNGVEAMTEAIDVRQRAGDDARVAVLYDPSGGRGQDFLDSDEWRRVGNMAWEFKMPIGFAGAVSPTNLEDVAAKVHEFLGGIDFWLDMESGVRTDDKMDKDKVLAVCQAAARVIGSGR